jgi:GNAT superfamily N-acetyltransferase
MHPAPPGLRIRPIGPGDETAVDDLLAGLDEESRFRRWFTGAIDVHEQARWAAHPERVHAVGLLAFIGEEVVGHAVLVPIDAHAAEVAFEVAAPWRHHGVAGHLLEALCEVARARGMDTLHAEVLALNADMLAVFREHGPVTEQIVDGAVAVDLPLGPPAVSDLPA